MASITFIDLEVNPAKRLILDMGAVRQDGALFHANSFNQLLSFIRPTEYIGGHNIINHDLKYLTPLFRQAGYEPPKAIDTLYLSPLLFPAKPYHHLLKDDKLQTDSLSNPLNDSKKAQELFWAEVEAFGSLDEELKYIYFSLLHPKEEFGCFFDFVGYVPTKEGNLETAIRQRFDNEICEYAPLASYIEKFPIELSYCLALIDCHDRFSITPPWVMHNYQKVESIMYTLRNTPCLTGCKYCNQAFDAHRGLKKFFGFDAYRTYNGQPLQENAVRAAIKGKSILAIFPTGGGKSITFQVPALMAGEQVKGLTVVISPLQSLMKDQVDNLRKNHIIDAVTINGLLDPIERAESFEKVEDGSASILYISPESLRSNSIERALLGRKIVRFVIDEAHCFSSWGQDFRVDYLYIGDFLKQIQEKKKLEQPIPVSCFTATAKQEVIEDIAGYFKEKLNIQLELFRSDSSRTNLQYQVFNRSQEEEKYNCLREIIEQKNCPTIVYVARTRTATKLTTRLIQDGFSAAAFHGKMETRNKTENQNDFISGKIQIMVATSAFGMGVDKKDVGLVVHYEISDSLENYVQEAGRAGRDEHLSASCYILFDEEDLSKHFILLNQTKLHIGEIQQVWKAIKNITRFRSSISQSALEIARKAGWDESIINIETRVKTAIAALEEAGYLHRGKNIPRVFANSILAETAQEAIDKIQDSTHFNDKQKSQATRIVKKLISAKSWKHNNNEIPEARIDYISDHLGIPNEEVIQIITQLREEKILADACDLTAYIIKKEQRNHSLEIIRLYNSLESFLLRNFKDEQATFNLKETREQAEVEIQKNISPDKLKTLINFWAEKNWIKRTFLDESKNHVSIHRSSTTNNPLDKNENRHILSEFIINYLFAKTEQNSEKTTKDEVFVEFSILELKEAYEKQQKLFLETISSKEIEDTLFYLSRIGALQIEGGFLITYNKLAIKRLEQNNKVQYKQDDYRKLEQFYSNKIQKIHIVGEYARKMIQNYQEALQFVDDYFRLNNNSFIHKYFPGSRKDEINRRITPAKYRQLFGELSETQLKIVNDNQPGHIVVAAGPGSGKTRLLVHKLASLLLMEDVKHEQLLMLTFSRAAANEFRKRLHDLIGNAVGYIEIKTFHSYCFDLLGRQGSIEKSESVIKDTVEKIRNNEVEMSRITKSVLVIDEAQDMTEDEFELITALMEKNESMRVIAVGDDDQNIYAFRHSDSRYMQSLISKYEARSYELCENFRSKSNLVAFANSFVSQITHRMKHTPILPHQLEEGDLRITYHHSNHLIIPTVRDVLESPLTGTTCILTKTNEEAVFIACLLQEQGVPTQLIQTNKSSFYLTDLNEIRYFTQELNLTQDTYQIDNERWEAAKRKLKYEFGNTSSWEVCRNIVLYFEQSYSQKYISDWKTYLYESQLENFYSIQSEKVVVSTIHKAKGKEFDNVFLLLNSTDPLSDERKREIYVAITRAKHNLSIHLNGQYLANAGNGLAQFRTDENHYFAPQSLCYLLTHRDLWLNFFISSHCQAAISKLKSGMPLQVTEKGCWDLAGNEIIRFSERFKKILHTLKQKGYEPKEASVNFIVYWKRKEDNKEVKIVLPKVIVRKTE